LAAPAAPRYDPTEDMSNFDKLRAGMGKAFVDVGRGVGQLVGMVSPEEVAESRQRDAALMSSGAGRVGNVLGNVAAALPAMMIPGAATLPGAAAVGAAQGFIQPTAADGERLTNTMVGAAAGGGGVLAGRALKAGYQASKALAAPFTEGGRQMIAGRMINRFAENPNALARANGGQTITGAVPTVAEATGDAGMARLQDALRALDPQIENRIGQRLSANNAARVNALESLAGDTAKRTAAEQAREAATKPLYQAAFAQEVPVTAELQALLNRPSMQKALARAAGIAKEEGREFGLQPGAAAVPARPGSSLMNNSTPAVPATPPSITGQTLQDIKMGMDALLKDPASGIAGKEIGAVRATRNAWVRMMEDAIPEFGTARTTYAAMSKPLNGMEVGEEIARRGTSNTSNLAGDPRMQANALLGLLRDEPALLRRATGRNELQSLSQVFEPGELNLLRAIAGETDRAAAVAAAGAGPGSATAQRMASQNVLRQLIGPTGLPQSWAESALANTAIGKPLNLIYGGVAEPRIQQALADAVLDPALAGRLAAAARPVPAAPNPLLDLLMNGVRVGPAAISVSRER
jgi:hypothetical protein